MGKFGVMSLLTQCKASVHCKDERRKFCGKDLQVFFLFSFKIFRTPILISVLQYFQPSSSVVLPQDVPILLLVASPIHILLVSPSPPIPPSSLKFLLLLPLFFILPVYSFPLLFLPQVSSPRFSSSFSFQFPLIFCSSSLQSLVFLPLLFLLPFYNFSFLLPFQTFHSSFLFFLLPPASTSSSPFFLLVSSFFSSSSFQFTVFLSSSFPSSHSSTFFLFLPPVSNLPSSSCLPFQFLRVISLPPIPFF